MWLAVQFSICMSVDPLAFCGDLTLQDLTGQVVNCRAPTITAPPRAPPAAPKQLPPLPAPEERTAAPQGQPAEQQTSSREGTLAEQRLKKGLRPGQLDTDIGVIGHRMRELAGRRSYLRNFWYAAGGCSHLPLCHDCIVCMRYVAQCGQLR